MLCIDPEWCGTPDPAAFTQQSIPPCPPPQSLHTPVHPPALLWSPARSCSCLGHFPLCQSAPGSVQAGFWKEILWINGNILLLFHIITLFVKHRLQRYSCCWTQSSKSIYISQSILHYEQMGKEKKAIKTNNKKSYNDSNFKTLLGGGKSFSIFLKQCEIEWAALQVHPSSKFTCKHLLAEEELLFFQVAAFSPCACYRSNHKKPGWDVWGLEAFGGFLCFF